MVASGLVAIAAVGGIARADTESRAVAARCAEALAPQAGQDALARAIDEVWRAVLAMRSVDYRRAWEWSQRHRRASPAAIPNQIFFRGAALVQNYSAALTAVWRLYRGLSGKGDRPEVTVLLRHLYALQGELLRFGAVDQVQAFVMRQWEAGRAPLEFKTIASRYRQRAYVELRDWLVDEGWFAKDTDRVPEWLARTFAAVTGNVQNGVTWGIQTSKELLEFPNLELTDSEKPKLLGATDADEFGERLEGLVEARDWRFIP